MVGSFNPYQLPVLKDRQDLCITVRIFPVTALASDKDQRVDFALCQILADIYSRILITRDELLRLPVKTWLDKYQPFYLILSPAADIAADKPAVAMAPKKDP